MAGARSKIVLPPIALNSVTVLFHSALENRSWNQAAVIGYGGPKGAECDPRKQATNVNAQRRHFAISNIVWLFNYMYKIWLKA